MRASFTAAIGHKRARRMVATRAPISVKYLAQMVMRSRLLRGAVSLLFSLLVAALLIIVFGVVVPFSILHYLEPQYGEDGFAGAGMLIVIRCLAALAVAILPTVALVAHVYR